MSRDELALLRAADFRRLKLTEEEKQILKEINAERQRERSARVENLRREQAPIVADLQSAGLAISALSDLIGRSERYEAAIPILLKHLQSPYSDATKETIARSLAVPEAQVRRAWPVLVREYSAAPTGKGLKAPGDVVEYRLGAKDGLACALAVAVTDETLPELIALAMDARHGGSRLLLLPAIRKSKSPRARAALEELAADPELKKEIASWRR
jgi:hypothetical protein